MNICLIILFLLDYFNPLTKLNNGVDGKNSFIFNIFTIKYTIKISIITYECELIEIQSDR